MPPTKTASSDWRFFYARFDSALESGRDRSRSDPALPVHFAHVPLDFVDFGTIFGTALQ